MWKSLVAQGNAREIYLTITLWIHTQSLGETTRNVASEKVLNLGDTDIARGGYTYKDNAYGWRCAMTWSWWHFLGAMVECESRFPIRDTVPISSNEQRGSPRPWNLALRKYNRHIFADKYTFFLAFVALVEGRNCDSATIQRNLANYVALVNRQDLADPVRFARPERIGPSTLRSFVWGRMRADHRAIWITYDINVSQF